MNLPQSGDQLIVALDVPTIQDAHELVQKIGDAANFYKIGLELLYGGGLEFAREMIGKGYKIFIDAKLHDIPNTVERATRQLSKLGASLLTVHAYPQTMQAALNGREGDLRLLGVTVLTSMSEEDAKAAGYTKTIPDIIKSRTQAAHALKMDGVVCSPQEARIVRMLFGSEALIVTPGIRLPGNELGDQSRAATPFDAIRNGASHIVVGRPITRADDPRAAAMKIIDHMSMGKAT